MYLHLGKNRLIQSRQVIGIFDLDTSTISKNTRDFLRRAEQNKQVEITLSELPKSFVLYGEEEFCVALSPLNTYTIKKKSK